MAALKFLLAAIVIFFITGASGVKHCCETQRISSSAYLQRGEQVQESYLLQLKRLQRYYESLSDALRSRAPDQLALLEPRAPLAHGYQILPKIIPDRPSPEPRPVRSSWYSWAWTEKLIADAREEIVRFETELESVLRFGAKAHVYERLARSYRYLQERQQNIHAHIQYNRLWQAAIAADRPSYDRATVLHDAVLERQAILDALASPAHTLLEKAFAAFRRMQISHGLFELNDHLVNREKLLARMIHAATDRVNVPAFIRVERTLAGWTFHVPVYTDVSDGEFIRIVKEQVENIWRLRHSGEHFRVVLAVSVIPVSRLYTTRPLPGTGDGIDLRQHIARFPLDGAILTTGAVTTHVYDRAIILGPHELSPRVLAHEFGHILGFKDNYFRGYKDLGNGGFQVMEVPAGHDDIMGSTATHTVRHAQFMRILQDLLKAESAAPSGL
jgi:hypothetical protein